MELILPEAVLSPSALKLDTPAHASSTSTLDAWTLGRLDAPHLGGWTRLSPGSCVENIRLCPAPLMAELGWLLDGLLRLRLRLLMKRLTVVDVYRVSPPSLSLSPHLHRVSRRVSRADTRDTLPSKCVSCDKSSRGLSSWGTLGRRRRQVGVNGGLSEQL